MQHAPERLRLRGVFRHGKSFASRGLQKFTIAQWIRNMKTHVARLTGAKEFTGAAKLQIRFGNFETVIGADHGFEPRARLVRHPKRSNQDAVRFFRAASNSAAQLMPLRKPKPPAVSKAHPVGVGTITATSTTVVATRICTSFFRKRCITSSFSSLESRPCRSPTRSFGKTSFESRSYSSIAALSSSLDSSITG